VVNNEEITQREVRADMSPAEQQSADSVGTTREVLNRVIDRNLLAQFARDQGLDREPDYVTRRRQLEQALLATMAMRKIAGPAANPSTADAQAFISRNPLMFAQRQQLTLDQISMASPTPLTKVGTYSGLGSIDAIAAALKAEGVPFTRGRQQLDTGGVAKELAQQIVKLKNGEPFAVSTNGTTYLSAVLQRAPAATPQDTWLPSATDAVRQEKGNALMTAELAKLRKSAEIVYDPAFKDATTKNGAAKK
jgi:peptidyl-prolyl cis-trans isomerase C